LAPLSEDILSLLDRFIKISLGIELAVAARLLPITASIASLLKTLIYVTHKKHLSLGSYGKAMVQGAVGLQLRVPFIHLLDLVDSKMQHSTRLSVEV